MRIQKGIRGFVYLTVAGLFFSATVLGQSTHKVEPIASVAGDRSEIRWRPQTEYGRLVLTVSTPDGSVIRQEFEEGADPSFKLIDTKGLSLPDGQYTYELRVIPKISPEAKKALAASRENGNSEEVIRELQKSGQVPTKITVQSGSFRVEKGVAFTGSPEEGAEPRSPDAARTITLQNKKKKGGGETVVIQDVVTADDEIIQGSLCVGLDCVNNESFGFDTIRLKENNTRIKFDDTSTSAGFPNNDWQLTANDSASGGANKFSIEDITGAKVPFTVIAGAPTNSVFVASNGKLGLRTSTPVLDVHANTSDTPAIRLEQNNSGGFTAQTWDIGGNEANFFVRDITGGSRLPFRIRPGAPTSSIDISASGNVGIGTASPAANVHLFGTSTADVFFGLGPDPINGPALNIGYAGSSFGSGATFLNARGASGTLRLLTNSVAALFIDTSQRVGIGTTSPAGKLDVNGSIFQRGVQLFADYVFEPTYTVESIEDHAAFMWNNRHLPAVGARQVDEQGREFVEIGARMRGMLEEIEKAHVYISTLNERITEKDAELTKLARQNAELAERLARIEAMLSDLKNGRR
jgi:hypothetical protein